MKKIPIAVIAAFLAFSPVMMSSCKSKKETTKDQPKTTTTENPPPVEPVVTANDDELNRGVTDAIKDHPTVHYSLVDGKIVLTGEISKDKWMTLKQNLDKLKSKGYELSGLTIK